MNAEVLHKIGYGLYIVSSRKGNRVNGQIANVVFQITSKPKTIGIVINKQNLTHEFIVESRVFSVSILSKDTPIKFIGTFGFKSGRDIDKFKDLKYKTGSTGSPLVMDNCIGYFECKVISQMEVGTHNVFVGELVDGEIINDKEPMEYSYYHVIKSGREPDTAPTYRKEEMDERTAAAQFIETQPVDGKSKKFRCTVCGYVYVPERGDPDSGIPAGTEFTDLPDTWVCPICGVGKDKFEEVKD